MVTHTTTTAELVETGEKRDALGRKHRPQDQRTELLAAFRASGLTQIAFARREGIKYSTFCTWVQKAREVSLVPATRTSAVPAKSAAPKPRVRFTELRLPAAPAPSGLEVRLPDGTVLRGGSAAELAKLVCALRA